MVRYVIALACVSPMLEVRGVRAPHAQRYQLVDRVPDWLRRVGWHGAHDALRAPSHRNPRQFGIIGGGRVGRVKTTFDGHLVTKNSRIGSAPWQTLAAVDTPFFND